MKFTKKELLFLKTVTNKALIGGIFDYENNDESSFEKFYGLTMEETDRIADLIRGKVFAELNKYDFKTIAREINKKLQK